ncbi:MAG: hypothetical protein E2O42_06280 [Nitrospina sp.]|nr:MAG: hypothetical protein E2O42_06280 [Nitrospina sp.]
MLTVAGEEMIPERVCRFKNLLRALPVSGRLSPNFLKAQGSVNPRSAADIRSDAGKGGAGNRRIAGAQYFFPLTFASMHRGAMASACLGNPRISGNHGHHNRSFEQQWLISVVPGDLPVFPNKGIGF